MLQSIAVSTPNLLIVDDDEQILDCFRCTFSLDNNLPGGWVFAGIEIVYRGFKSCQWNSVLGKRLCWTTSGQSAVLGSGVQPPLQNPR